MKKTLCLTVAALACGALLFGCAPATPKEDVPNPPATDTDTPITEPVKKEDDKENSLPSDKEIMETLAPFLENADKIDISAEDSFKSNLGFDKTGISGETLYMGAPKQNTTYFCMLTLDDSADKQAIKEKLNSILDGWVQTAKQGYTTGYDKYEIIEKDNKLFAVMHEKAESFDEIVAYLNSL